MTALTYGWPFAFLALAPLGFQLGGAWSFLLLGVMPVSLTLFDWLLGEHRAAEPSCAHTPYRLVPWLYIPLQVTLTAWGAWIVAQPATPTVAAVGLTLSTGLAAGVFGFVAAHEMVHSRRRAERALGLVQLASVLYAHFAISHIHGHHRRAATLDDPATARRGESAYAFLVRSIGGQLGEAWACEARRLRRTGCSPFSAGNRMLTGAAIEASLVLAIGLFSLRALAFFLGQALLAIVLLELFNYVAHYGLMRRARLDGRLERLGPQHAWNTARRMNNWSFFNMGRHSDHHRFAARPYQRLETLDGAANLPTGYSAALLLALIPPLWRKVMDSRVDRVMAGPVS